MSARVEAIDNHDTQLRLTARGLPEGTVLDPLPTAVLVIESLEGAYVGHLELSPENAHILSEEIRKAAEAAANKEEH